MKTLSLNPFILVKSFFIGLKQKEQSEKSNRNTKATTGKSIKDKETNQVNLQNSRFDMNAFERKAHIGNYFAGPHCVFNPGFFKS